MDVYLKIDYHDYKWSSELENMTVGSFHNVIQFKFTFDICAGHMWLVGSLVVLSVIFYEVFYNI